MICTIPTSPYFKNNPLLLLSTFNLNSIHISSFMAENSPSPTQPRSSIARSFGSQLYNWDTKQIDVAVDRLDLNEKHGFPNNGITTSKYNILTFLPLNLFEQFRRLSNVYFLIIMIVSLIPAASPITPIAAVMPLILVLTVGAGKDGYEDYRRHVEDNKANSQPTHVFRNGEWQELESRDVAVGDIVMFRHGEEVRADCILFNSAMADGIVYIDTANLDGETSLRTRKAKPICVEKYGSANEIHAANQAPLIIATTTPTANLAYFKGQLRIGAQAVLGLTIDQFLPRGAVVRNTEWAVCVVCFVGEDTKLFLNLKQKPPKQSYLDEKLNVLVFAIFVLNIVAVLILCGLAVSWVDGQEKHGGGSGVWYLHYYHDFEHGARLYFWRALAFIVVLSFTIPISLFITLELNKAVQAVLMMWDNRMAYFQTNNNKWKFCRPKTSGLNEQLAQVRYIFSDKTGTLTENRMHYIGGCVLGVEHNELTNPGGLGAALKDLSDTALEQHPAFQYLLALAFCHSVMCFEDPDDPNGCHYEGASPDECALVQAARANLCQLVSRSSTQMVVRFAGRFEVVVRILAELEFTPERKMMSMLVQRANGQATLLTKGADSAMIPRLRPNDRVNSQFAHASVDALTRMATLGFRTLVVGYRNIDQPELGSWLETFNEASATMGNRAQELGDAYALIEKDFTLIGTTGVEDKLQEDVPKTIRFMLDAQIVVWMLTGDKRETAVTVAATSGLAEPMHDIIHHIDVSSMPCESEQLFNDQVTACRLQLDEGTRLCAAHAGRVVLVVDGISLHAGMSIDDGDVFFDLGKQCRSAVCCRLTPMQKADVVRLFQTKSKLTVLAIGDGANDVSMIQEARVGIGIMGLEGSQAELASDFAIPQFRFLVRLMVAHGRYCLFRNATCVLYSFYKNIMMSVGLIYYTFFSGYSGQIIYETWILSCFNLLFASLPPLSIGMLDKDLEDDIVEAQSSLFTPLERDKTYFNKKAIWEWSIDIVVHGTILYWFIHMSMIADDFSPIGGSLEHYGTVLFVCVVYTVDIRAMAAVARWDAIQYVSFVLTVLVVPMILAIYSALTAVESDTYMMDILWQLCASRLFYLQLFFAVGGMFVVLNVLRAYLRQTECPTLVQCAVAKRYVDPPE